MLATGRVTFTEAVDDLEIRVYAGEDDVVRLESYELVPVRGDAEPSQTD